MITVQRRPSGYTFADSDAQNWANNVASSDGNVQLENAIKQAVDTYVQTLKTTGLGGAAGSLWSQAVQLLLPCGPLTLAGALRPLKGAAPTNGNGSAGSTQFASNNYNRKNGLGDAANASKYLNSNVAASSVGVFSHALAVYGSLPTPGANAADAAIGQADTNDANVIDFFNYVNIPGYIVGRTVRSGTNNPALTPVLSLGAATSSLVGSRTANNIVSIYSDSASATNTNSVTSFSPTRSFFIFAVNYPAGASGFSAMKLQASGIFSSGLNATQAAAWRTANATYVAAVAAATP